MQSHYLSFIIQRCCNASLKGYDFGIDIYTYKALLTLWFWRSKNLANSLRIVNNKATETPHGMYCIQPSLASCDFCRSSLKWGYYIFTSTWGFQRCSFRQFGQCESLYCVERVTVWLHAWTSMYFVSICKSKGTL